MSQFANYTRSTAFNLTMSAEAITELLNLEVFSKPAHSSEYSDAIPDFYKPEFGAAICRKGIVGYLLRRGLITAATAPNCESNWMLSNAGLLLCPLLREAGFTAEFRRVEQEGRAFIIRDFSINRIPNHDSRSLHN